MDQATPHGHAFPSTTSSLETAIEYLQPHACLICSQRKVKCDRRTPCNSCTKAHVECAFRDPAPPQRRKRKATEDALTSRVQHYEELLRGLGVDPVAIASDTTSLHHEKQSEQSESSGTEVGLRTGHKAFGSNQGLARLPNTNTGKIIVEDGKALYVENTLWTSLTDELNDKPYINSDPIDNNRSKPYILDADGGDLMLGLPLAGSGPAIQPLHSHLTKLWPIFLDNVNPLVKILHVPTVQHIVEQASANMYEVSRGITALLCSICFSAINSLSSEECENMLSDAKTHLLSRYQLLTRQALINASFLRSSELDVLQAFVLFLLMMRETYDSRTLWTLTGVAMRIGENLGLHRDGAKLRLLPLEVELRRRLWWQIIILDGRSGELSGTNTSISDNQWDTKLPLNINDRDLSPDMTVFPPERPGATEMIFCLLRYEVGEYFRNMKSSNTVDRPWEKLASQEKSIADKEKAVDDLERLLQDKFLKYCDPLDPLHVLCSSIARTVICKSRLVAYHPRYRLQHGATVTEQERDMLFLTSLKIIEYCNYVQSTKSMQRFLWHVRDAFQWDAFIYLLSELRFRSAGTVVDKAWRHIEEVFEHHPEIIDNEKKALHVAIASLTLKAWAPKEAKLTRAHQNFTPQCEAPGFIAKIRAQRSNSPCRARDTPPGGSVVQGSSEDTPQDSEQRQQSAFDGSVAVLGAPQMPDFTYMPMSPMEWAMWDDLLQDSLLECREGVGSHSLR